VTFTDYVAARRAEVDAALDLWLPRPDDCPSVIAEAMRYSVMAGGKRLRPILTLAAAEAVANAKGAPVEAARRLALPAACAIEMVHTYSLIHDDLPAMDDDTLRRGRPTLHVVYGEGMAILAGDGLHAEAFGLMARYPDTDAPEMWARKLRTLAVVAHAAGTDGMVGGQAIDLAAAAPATHERLTLDADGLRGMHARKTGALIRASVVAGAVMAGAEPRVEECLSRYATEVGLAFQIVDDILDVSGLAATLGKTVGKDAAAGKPTYPAFFGLDRSHEMAAECLARARQALADAGVADRTPLGDIADWVVGRSQ